MASRFNGSLQPPLFPRNGRTLEIVLVCRVSDPGPNKQDIRSNDDQDHLNREWLGSNTNLPVNITGLAGSGSGEWLERGEYLRLIDLVESDQYDLILTEDLGRIVRRIHAHLFAELCVDHHVRLISLNDHVDTAQDGWQDRSIFAAWHHERSNRDTSERIKRTHRSRFTQGGVVGCLPYGYRKKPGAKSDADVEKLPEAEEVYKEWFRLLDEDGLYSEIADWLNASGVPVGPNVRKDKWNCQLVGQTSHNWLLKGIRYRNKRRSKRHNASGKYITEKADSAELLVREVPHLAFFEEAYYDRVITKADARNAKYRRNSRGGPDPCKNRSRKRVRYPGDAVDCGLCGWKYVFGGHGQKDHLMCDGARGHVCWDGATVDGPMATQNISDAVFTAIEAIPDFDPAFLGMVNEEAQKHTLEQESRLRELLRKIEAADRDIANVMKFIRAGDDSPNVRADLKQLEQQQLQWTFDKQEIERLPREDIVIPRAEELRQMAREAFQDLARDSYQFAKRLKAVTGRILVWPFQCIDGGAIVLRAKFTLQIANLLPDRQLRESLLTPLNRVVMVDLFDPPQYVKFREAVVAGRKNATEREVAAALGITTTAAQHAAQLNRLMQQQGLDDPYIRLLEPPEGSKLRRHHHPRYRFEPRPGFPAEW